MRSSPIPLIGLLIAILSAGAMAFGVYALTQRLAARNVDMVRLVGRVSASDSIMYHGQECRVEFIPDEKTGQTGLLRVHWRGQSLDFPTWMEHGDGHLLEQHTGWFGVMILADGAPDAATLKSTWKSPEGPATRLVVAARYPAEGYDPRSWGLVRRRDWQYRMVLLEPEGPPEQAFLEFDKNYEEIDAIYLPGKYTKLYRPHLLPKSPEERHENLWMYYAAAEVTPPMQFRGRDKASEEVIAAMGWPWPVAAGGSIGVTLGLALFASGRLSRTRVA